MISIVVPATFFDEAFAMPNAHRRRIFGLTCLSYALVAGAALAAAPNDAPPPPPKPKAQPTPAAPKGGSGLKEIIDKVDHGMVDERVLTALKAAAESGSGPAAQRLAYLYLSGVGMEINYPQAYHWYCVAALRNTPFAIDTAIKVFNRMSPSARVFAENLIATSLTPSEIARLNAMRPPDATMMPSHPGSDNGSTGDSSTK
jgi:TPR repeat protein